MHKKLYFVPLIVLTSQLILSCGKERENKKISIQSDNYSEKIKKPLTSIILGSEAELGAGYNKMATQIKPSCLTEVKSENPKNIKNTTVSYQDDLTEESLRNLLNLDISATVPLLDKGIDISPKIAFARDAAKTKLSHTATYVIDVNLGRRKLNYSEPFKILPQYEDYFSSTGDLNDSFDFTKKCGYEVVTSQSLSSKLVITAKVMFDSISDLKTFEAKLGVSGTIAPSWGINLNIKDIDENVRRKMQMKFYATQIGGHPENLLSILGKNYCTLDKLTECQDILNKINTYLSTDYKMQLDPKNLDAWDIEQLNTVPFDNINIVNSAGKKLNLSLTKNYPDSKKLLEVESEVSKMVTLEKRNYYLAEAMKKSNYLATDEKETLDEILNNSLQNVNKLVLFSEECYRNFGECYKLYKNDELSTIISNYDKKILDPNIGELISKTYSKTQMNSYFDQRSSEPFVQLHANLEKGKYTSYYFKFKTTKNQLIKDENVFVDISCTRPLSIGPVIFLNTVFAHVFSNYEVSADTALSSFQANCSENTPLTIASPYGFEENIGTNEHFIVELWGRL